MALEINILFRALAICPRADRTLSEPGRWRASERQEGQLDRVTCETDSSWTKRPCADKDGNCKGAQHRLPGALKGATAGAEITSLKSHTILYYTIPYHTVLYYTILYYTILYYTILYYTILYYTILYYTILYYTILYYTILYYTIRGHRLELHPFTTACEAPLRSFSARLHQREEIPWSRYRLT